MRRGINRPDIETLLNEAVVRLTGLPEDRVFFSEYADDTVAPLRPCVTMTLMPYETEQKQGTVFYTPSLELWRLEITSSVDGDYAVTVDGVEYVYAAVDEDMSDIRDGLAAAIAAGADADYTSVAAATRSIDITSDVPGKRLVVIGGPGVSASLLRSDVLKTVSRAVELRLEIQCVGEYASPSDVSLTGADIAERLKYALLDPDETAAMRAAGHHITRARATDARRIIDGQAETIGIIDAVLGTTSLHVGTTVGSGRAASVTFTERTP
jgi:hypothetical protein